LKVHPHALVLDGVFASDGVRPRFHPLPAQTTADVADVLATIVPRVTDWLARYGDGNGDNAVAWTERRRSWRGSRRVGAGRGGHGGRMAMMLAQRFRRIEAASDASRLAVCQSRHSFGRVAEEAVQDLRKNSMLQAPK
jgi:hypothetical protein